MQPGWEGRVGDLTFPVADAHFHACGVETVDVELQAQNEGVKQPRNMQGERSNRGPFLGVGQKGVKCRGTFLSV